VYSFTGAHDGHNPTQVLVGNDGNLYGIARGGVFGGGVVFQLTFTGGQWTPTVAHAFGGIDNDSGPGYLVQDSAGNLYGIASNGYLEHGAIFVLLKTGSGWGFSQTVVYSDEFDALNNLAIDSAGNLYGTGEAYSTIAGAGDYKNPGYYLSYASYIFKASYANGNWRFQAVVSLPNQILDSSGNLATDTSGNVYGTTSGCGTNNFGTMWQLSP